jgi:cytosine/adenosine deaminase-related metal-dependent hydrolase
MTFRLTGLPPSWSESTDKVLAEQDKLYERFHNTANGRIRMWYAIRTIFNATDELLLRTKRAAAERGVGIHMHVAEINEEVQYCKQHNGTTTVTHLEKFVLSRVSVVAHCCRLGVLAPNLLAVHSVWLTDSELDMYANRSAFWFPDVSTCLLTLGQRCQCRTVLQQRCGTWDLRACPKCSRRASRSQLELTEHPPITV